MQDFKGKTAVVTGAASGIGLAMAQRFAAAGMRVVLADIQQDALDHAVRQLGDRQAEVLGVVADVMIEESVHALADRAINEFGKIHILCNNAGVTNSASAGLAVWELPNTDWDWLMGVNFQGVLYGLQAFVPHMLGHGESGHIVNTASGAALLPGQGPYGISKHAVLCLTETLYFDLHAVNAAIGASVLCPGFVATSIVDAERNRPTHLESGKNPIDPGMIAAGQAVMAQGKDPSVVAEEVLQAVRDDDLYILPNRAWDNLFTERLEHILKRKEPLVVDTGDVVKRLIAGEDF